MQRQHHQVLGGLNLRGETPNDTRIVNVAALRDLDHGEVMLNDEAKRVAVAPSSPRRFATAAESWPPTLEWSPVG